MKFTLVHEDVLFGKKFHINLYYAPKKIPNIMNVYERLEVLKKEGVPFEIIQEYLLGCLESYLDFRSRGTLNEAIGVAKMCMIGKESWSKLHYLQWCLEAEAFEIDHFIEKKSEELLNTTINDLMKVETKYGIDREQALMYLRDLAYFIDAVFSSVAFPQNGIPSQKYEKFLDTKLFIRSFQK